MSTSWQEFASESRIKWDRGKDWLQQNWLLLLQATVSVTLLARGWLTWRWDSPIRALIWQEDWWSQPLESLFGIPWAQFAQHSEPGLTSVLEGLGILMMALAVVPWFGRIEKLRWTKWLLVPATGLLVLDAMGGWVSVDQELGMAIEHSLQVITPIALLLALNERRGRDWYLVVAIAASLTFVGHGLYALGFHAVPLIFKTMTMRILGCDLDTALVVLQIAGWLDMIAVVLLWIPRLRRWGIGYMVLWGLATALARIWAHVRWSQTGWGLDPWLAETLVRTAHWMLPLLLITYFSGRGVSSLGRAK